MPTYVEIEDAPALLEIDNIKDSDVVEAFRAGIQQGAGGRTTAVGTAS